MTAYEYRRRRRRVRINKVRFGLFILTCVLLMAGIVYGVKAMFFPSFPIDVRLTQDLYPDEGESLFQLNLEWEPIDVEKYESIALTIAGETMELVPTATSYEGELEASDATYEIELRAKPRGFGFSKKAFKRVQTTGDNQGMKQAISELKVVDDQLLFEHRVTDFPVNWQVNTVTYELVDLWNQASVSFTPEVVQADADSVTFHVSMPLGDFLESPSLSVMMTSDLEGNHLSTYVTDTFNQEAQRFVTSKGEFTLHLDHGGFVLMNDEVTGYTYKGHRFFAESLHVDVPEDVTRYQLMNRYGEVVVDQPLSHVANAGIALQNLDKGRYFLAFDGDLVHMNEMLHEVWYTVTRNEVANKVTVHNLNGMLALSVEKVSQLPKDVYDLLIDPGHGGPDGGTQGNDLSEAEETLRVSEYMARRFEEHGLKVRMTRTDDVEPAGKGNFNYLESPYYDNGRVEQVYRYETNYMISNHLNSIASVNLEGFEVYSSVFTTDEWSSLIADTLMDAGREPRDSEKNDYRVSKGSFKKSMAWRGTFLQNWIDMDADEIDFLYIIRESGGDSTGASSLLQFNSDSYENIPNFGAEAILIEHAYIDYIKDANRWRTDWKVWGEAVVKATVEYLGIDYIKG